MKEVCRPCSNVSGFIPGRGFHHLSEHSRAEVVAWEGQKGAVGGARHFLLVMHISKDVGKGAREQVRCITGRDLTLN